jgi:hypothetical protein
LLDTIRNRKNVGSIDQLIASDSDLGEGFLIGRCGSRRLALAQLEPGGMSAGKWQALGLDPTLSLVVDSPNEGKYRQAAILHSGPDEYGQASAQTRQRPHTLLFCSTRSPLGRDSGSASQEPVTEAYEERRC